MRKVLFCFYCIPFIFYTQAVKAQTATEQSVTAESSWEADKKAVLAEMMQFEKEEAAAFWPLYQSYMKDWCKLMNYRIYRIMIYCEDLRTLTPPASQITEDLFANDAKLARLQKKTYKKIRKILSAPRATQFMQLEYSMQLSILSEMQQIVIGDFVKKL